jgi:hypothetical protein
VIVAIGIFIAVAGWSIFAVTAVGSWATLFLVFI